MGTRIYMTKDGKRVPSVTTIIHGCKEYEFTQKMMHWAVKKFKELGDGWYDETAFSEFLNADRTDFGPSDEQIMEWAIAQFKTAGERWQQDKTEADEGTEMHELIEVYAKNPSVLIPEDVMLAYKNFLEWMRISQMTFESIEFWNVDDVLRFGGTMDAVGFIQGRRVLCDWKSGNLYDEHKIQLAAYRHLYQLAYPERPIEEGHLLRFDRKRNKFIHEKLSTCELDIGWRMFKNMREIYDDRKRLKGKEP